MNETNLITRLQQNIKIGENCQKVKYDSHTMGNNSPILGPNSCIKKPSNDLNLDKIFKELETDDFNSNITTAPVGKEPLVPKNKNQNSKPKYEMVNHPKHYNNYDVEVVDMMEKIWGTKATMDWCKMTAYKYRMRMGTKPGNYESPEAMKAKLLEDFNKEQWYLKKADELKSKLLDKSIDMNQ